MSPEYPASIQGFWGAPTSTVDWCEANYQHSFYICEFFNTLSGFAMIIAGGMGLALYRRVLSARFLMVYAALILVGIGSVAFHATLKLELQMLDELPMLYLALLMVHILVENQPKPRFGRWFPVLLVTHAALLTYLCAFTRGKLQFWIFQLSFGSLELFALVQTYRIYKGSNHRGLRKLYRLGMSAYLLAVTLWFIDIRFCDALSTLPNIGLFNPQLHAVWHVLVSCGFYLLLLVIRWPRAVVP
jgi:dihydroceramidase